MEFIVIGLVIAGAGIGVGWMLYQQQKTALEAAYHQQKEQAQTIATLRDDIAARQQSVDDMQQELGRADSLILKLRETIAQNDGTISALQKRLDEYEEVALDLRKQIRSIEQDSRQSKALFSTISTVAYDLVFVLDGHSIIIATNQSASEFFGSERSPIGETFTDVVNAPELEDIVTRALSEEESLEEQFKIDTRYYRARTQVMRYGDDHIFIGVAMQDITQLVRLNRARRDMVANISHELSTPIANIRLIIDSLFHEQSRPKRKASIASLRAIARETESLQWTVQELLDLSMIESGQAIMKLIEEPLAEIGREAVERLGDQLHKKNINIVMHIPPRMRVLCDREHIRRVFTNLISNAIKWSPEDDAITVSARNGSEEVTISVFDNGPGVPEDQRERIFERFYQVDTARSGEGGSGLGLAICKHVIESHGGRIWAEGNAQGGGGRFLFTLLNANAETEIDDVYMDKGQHDFIIKNQPPPVSNPERTPTPPTNGSRPDDNSEAQPDDRESATDDNA